jgi:uncharacterized protein (DUF362 family)
MKEKVCVGKVAGNMDLAVGRLFGEFPEVRRRLEECKSVFIKVNAVYFYPHLHTSLSLVEAVIEYIRNIDSRKSIFLMENCSQGNFTRLCFSAIGLDALAKKLRVNCLYLDEEKSVQVEMAHGDETETIRFPRILQERLIDGREEHVYLNIPVLKAHCQTQMTAGIKNQLGLLYDRDKAKHHNTGLHQKLVDILKYIRPDFTLVDALKVLERGPTPPGKFVEGRLHEKDVIVGGADVVAVDAVCEKILGYEPHTVRHVALADEQRLGTADLQKIEIVGELPPCTERIPWELKPNFPKSLRMVVGSEGACYEGCLGHFEQVLELLVNENMSPDEFENLPLTVVTGKGFKPEQLEGLEEPIILLGKCACEEIAETLRAKHIGVDCLNTCGRCDNILATAARHLNLNVLDLSPLSRLESYRQFLTGKLHGLQFRIPR